MSVVRCRKGRCIVSLLLIPVPIVDKVAVLMLVCEAGIQRRTVLIVFWFKPALLERKSRDEAW